MRITLFPKKYIEFFLHFNPNIATVFYDALATRLPCHSGPTLITQDSVTLPIFRCACALN